MTVREQIIRRVLDMDDAEATRTWDQIATMAERTTGGSREPVEPVRPELDVAGDSAGPSQPSWTVDRALSRDVDRDGPPTADELLAMIGSLRSDEPTDMANNKDEYIADAIEHGWR